MRSSRVVTNSLSTALSHRYGIERELGAGGMATVFLGQDLKHGHKVAFKVLSTWWLTESPRND